MLRGRGPEGVQFVRGRCRATNKCTYCRTLYVVETVEMLTLDAMEWPPTLWAVLTAREHLTRRDTYRHLEQLRRAVRRRWPHAEWFVQVEFQRRGALHLNLLIKGVPVGDLAELRDVLVSRWCERVDAEPVGQWVAEIDDARGTVQYISKMLAHGLKAEQAPPLGWRGHRTSQTRGYLVRPASEMRLEARRAIRLKRLLREGVPGDLLEVELALRESIVWDLVEVAKFGGVIEPRHEVVQVPRHEVVQLGGGHPSGPVGHGVSLSGAAAHPGPASSRKGFAGAGGAGGIDALASERRSRAGPTVGAGVGPSGH